MTEQTFTAYAFWLTVAQSGFMLFLSLGLLITMAGILLWAFWPSRVSDDRTGDALRACMLYVATALLAGGAISAMATLFLHFIA